MSPAVISTATGGPPLLFHADTYNPAPKNQEESPGESAQSQSANTNPNSRNSLAKKTIREHHKFLKFTDQH